MDFFEDGPHDREQWELYARLLGYNDVIDMLEDYFRGKLIAEWDDDLLQRHRAAGVRSARRRDRLTDFSIDLTATRRYTGGEQLITVNLSGTTNKSRSQLPPQLKLSVGGSGGQALRRYVTLNVEDLRWTTRRRTTTARCTAGRRRRPARRREARHPGELRREAQSAARGPLPRRHADRAPEQQSRVLQQGALEPARSRPALHAARRVRDPDLRRRRQADLRASQPRLRGQERSHHRRRQLPGAAGGARVSGERSVIQPRAATAKLVPVSLFDHYKPLTPVSRIG